MSAEATPGTAEPFIAELKHWRDIRGFSQSALAKEVGYTPSYVSKVESGHQRPSRSFADHADRVLRAGGALSRSIRELGNHQRGSRPEMPGHVRDAGTPADAQPSSLIVEHDDAELVYDAHVYRACQRRKLLNATSGPVTRYLIRISVDRYPGDPERSNQLYRMNPLTWEEIDLHAQINGEPIGWRVQHDRDAFKELWLLFENEYGRYPIYPGESAVLEYSYTVSDDKWGRWFQRAVRLPTRRLGVRLDFPAALQPVVWGTETTMTAAALPLRTAIQSTAAGNRQLFSWSTDDPPLHARYRLEWKFRASPQDEKAPTPMGTKTASEIMQSIGIVQRGDLGLEQIAQPFNLPDEAEDARRVIAELNSTASRVAQVHVFGKGMGIAAPQIGVSRAAAIVQGPEGEAVTLLNPRVIEESPQTDEQYEGCLSFFDVRGMVPRPLVLHVEHQAIDGERHITIFAKGLARLVAHEIDHLYGTLYTKRMRPGTALIPVSEYGGTGERWQYSDRQN